MKDFKLKDVLISILIVSVTLLYFGDKYLDLEGVKTFMFLGFEIDSFGFLDISDLIFFSKMKVLILVFSITWYLTCRHWWRPVILIIIIIELFKLASIFNSNNTMFDEIEFIISLPFTIPLIIILLLFSLKINKYRLYSEVRNNLDEEIDDVFYNLNKENYNELEKLKIETINAKKAYFNSDKETYVKKLIDIRNQFYKL
ncbi:hypothetical protein [Psychroserpens ponticola]|uniref:Uncharacterized protein n=1 Tax=Psychroserpens ponticola TaxID=2932268 RepID=A0ABY7S279_9FLAO|nr:hypothetical protein [Psychroserpens ponticola]WCO03107.1 hypothetical protein MUN68_006340 [Psychroserpens ponticola]